MARKPAPGRSHRYPRGHLQIRLCSREHSCLIFLTLPPSCGPALSPHFFPGGGRVRMRRPPLRRPRGSGEVVAPGHPGSIGSVPSGRAAAGPAGGARIPGGGTRALGAAWRAATPPHTHILTSPQPRIPLACPAGSIRCGRRRTGTGSGSQLPARGRRLSSHWSARGQRPGRLCPATSCQIPLTTPSFQRFIPALCTCGGYGDNFFFLILALSPRATLFGHLVYNCSLRAVTAK